MRRPKGHIRQRSPGAWELPYRKASGSHTTLIGDRKAAE